jgi:transcriptional regulator with XRE-family HTH domain
MTNNVEACHQSLGSRIRLIRETIGMSQEELAGKLPKGVTRSSLANIETGRQRFLLNRVEDFARALGTTPKHLMKGIWW